MYFFFILFFFLSFFLLLLLLLLSLMKIVIDLFCSFWIYRSRITLFHLIFYYFDLFADKWLSVLREVFLSSVVWCTIARHLLRSSRRVSSAVRRGVAAQRADCSALGSVHSQTIRCSSWTTSRRARHITSSFLCAFLHTFIRPVRSMREAAHSCSTSYLSSVTARWESSMRGWTTS